MHTNPFPLASFLRVVAGRIALTAVFFCDVSGSSWAQLTTEKLIGSAVSLSNQDYPEVEKAIQRFNNQDFNGARDYLDIAREKDPKLPPSEITMAKMYLLARDGQNGRLLLEAAATNHPDDPETYLILAAQSFAEGRTTEAQALYEKAQGIVEKFSGNSKRKRNFRNLVLAGRAAAFERRKQWDKAVEQLQEWVDVDPESATPHHRLGTALFRADKPDDALQELKTAKELNPEVAHPYVTMGQLYGLRGDDEKARESFELAYGENSADEQISQAYIYWLIQQSDLDRAQEITSSLLEQAPKSTQALLLSGIVAKMQGEQDKAELLLKKVIDLAPSNNLAYDLLALLLIESDDVSDQERALSYAKVNAERFPQSAQANITLAWIYYQLGRKSEGDQALRKIKESRISSPDSAYLVARIMMESNQVERARSALESVINTKSGLFIFRREAEELLNELGDSE